MFSRLKLVADNFSSHGSGQSSSFDAASWQTSAKTKINMKRFRLFGCEKIMFSTGRYTYVLNSPAAIQSVLFSGARQVFARIPKCFLPKAWERVNDHKELKALIKCLKFGIIANLLCREAAATVNNSDFDFVH